MVHGPSIVALAAGTLCTGGVGHVEALLPFPFFPRLSPYRVAWARYYGINRALFGSAHEPRIGDIPGITAIGQASFLYTETFRRAFYRKRGRMRSRREHTRLD